MLIPWRVYLYHLSLTSDLPSIGTAKEDELCTASGKQSGTPSFFFGEKKHGKTMRESEKSTNIE